MSTTSSGKPTYLGLLNAVSLAESDAYGYYTEWASITPNPALREVLLAVAAREGEHGLSFAKRINELGYQLRVKPVEGAERALEIVRSDRTDLEKMEALGVGKSGGPDPDAFDGFFLDHSIDIRTGELLGRYIAEERDTGRMLRSCYEELCAAHEAAHGPKDGGKSDKASRSAAKQASALEAKVDALCRAVEELRQIVCAQSMPAASPEMTGATVAGSA